MGNPEQSQTKMPSRRKPTSFNLLEFNIQPPQKPRWETSERPNWCPFGVEAAVRWAA